LLAVASWALTNLTVSLTVDWDALGLKAATATIEARSMVGIQPQTRFGVHPKTGSVSLSVEANGGWLLVVS
jgi:hypothetical protein